jgi:hypothetical protein
VPPGVPRLLTTIPASSSWVVPAVWSIFLSPGATTARYPALPPAMQPIVPVSAPGCGFNLYGLMAGAGLAELFAFAGEDRVGSPSQFVSRL